MANPTVNLIKSGGRQASDTLSAAIDLDDLALPLNSADEFDDNSMIVIVDQGATAEEEMQVSGKTGSSLTVVTRGVNGTTAVGHDSGATVSAILSDWQWDEVIDAIDEEHDDDGKHTVDVIAEKTAATGVTIDSTLIKDGGVRVLNDIYQTGRNNADDGDVDMWRVNTSDQLEGPNDLRPTRFVITSTLPTIISTTVDSSGFTELDLTSETSSRAFAVSVTARILGNKTSQYFKMRKKGETMIGDETVVVRNQVTNTSTRSFGTSIVGLDTSQVLEYDFDEGGGTANISVYLRGYWEYLD